MVPLPRHPSSNYQQVLIKYPHPYVRYAALGLSKTCLKLEPYNSRVNNHLTWTSVGEGLYFCTVYTLYTLHGLYT